MNPSTAILVTTLSLLALPLVGRADVSEQAMDACVRTFVAATLPKEQRFVVNTDNPKGGPVDERASKYRIVLTATGSTSGRHIARGVCIANRDGEVIAFNGRRPPKIAQAKVATNEVAAR